jgi:hypothetical protein
LQAEDALTTNKADRVQLMIPDTESGNTESDPLWEPQQYRPSVVLARVDPVPDWTKSEQRKEAYLAPELPALPSMTTVVLGDRIGLNNDFGDMYYATLRDNATGEEAGGLVVSVIDVGYFSPVAHPTDAAQPDVRYFLGKEVNGYAVAARVQGKAIPRFGGLFGRGNLFCLFYEDAGDAVTEEARYNPQVR